MESRMDFEYYDALAIGLFALIGLFHTVWGIALVFTLVALPLGLAALVLGLAALYVAKQIFHKERAAWLVGLTVAILQIAVLPFLQFPSLFSSEVVLGAVSAGLILYLVIRHKRFGIGRAVRSKAGTREHSLNPGGPRGDAR